jgi:hypothetical protein
MREDSVTVDPRARTGPLVGAGRRPTGLVASLVLIAGAGLLVVSAIIHLHLWASGYKHIPKIGPLFLVQSIAGIVLALAVALIRRVFIAILGALYAAGTIAGLLVSVHHGLFGFRETMSAPWANTSLIIEGAAVVVLLVGGALVLRGERAGIRR